MRHFHGNVLCYGETCNPLNVADGPASNWTFDNGKCYLRKGPNRDLVGPYRNVDEAFDAGANQGMRIIEIVDSNNYVIQRFSDYS